MIVRTATGLLAWYMRVCGFEGWTSFWNTLYVLLGHEHDERLLRHERCHLEQIKRDGRLKFAIKYSWWTISYGFASTRMKYKPDRRKASHHDQAPISSQIPALNKLNLVLHQYLRTNP